MTEKKLESELPYAPVPVSMRATNLRIGSWFQTRPTAVKAFALLGVAVGLAYLTWRAVFTSVGIHPGLFWPLLAAEAFGFATFLMLVYEAWETPPTPRPPGLKFKTSVLITTYNEDREIIEPTIVGALRIRGATEIWLCDDGRRPEMASLAIQYGINYQVRDDNLNAKAGNVNAVLPKIRGELVLILDADHVPSPDILEALSGYFADESMALVQSAHSFRNHNSVMHEETGRHEQSLFFDVLLPGRNRHESAFWCGSAALLRVSALRSVGGVATKTSTEDFETSLLLQVAGFKMRYHNEHLIQGLAPDNLAAYVTQRARWAQGTLSAFRPGYALPLSRKLRLRQKISYFGAFLYYITPIQRIVYTAYLILVGVFGVIPVAQANLAYVLIWLSYVATTFFAVVALERGSTQPFEGVRNTFLTLEAFIRAFPVLLTKSTPGFKVTPKNEVDLGGWQAMQYIRLPLVIISINFFVLSMRWTDYLVIGISGAGFMPALPIFASLAMTFFGLVEIVIIGLLAKRLFGRRQLRKLWRFPVRLDARLAGTPVTVLDLHQSGLAILGPKTLFDTLEPLEIFMNLLDVYGRPTLATGKFQPKNLRIVDSGQNFARIGGEVIWDNAESRTNVIEYCYVTEPYRAKNRFWARRSPRMQVRLEAQVRGIAAIAIDLSIAGVAFQVATATSFDVGSTVPVAVWVDNQRITGRLLIRGASSVSPMLQRVGGEVQWDATGWLNKFISFEHEARQETASLHSIIRR